MSPHRWSTNLYTSYLATQSIESCQASPPPLWPCWGNSHAEVPTGHESLSILLHVARNTPHRGRTTPPGCIKRWSFVFREWVRPLAKRWSAMVASTLFSFKILSFFVWKTEGRTTCSRRLGHSFIDFAFKNDEIYTESPSLYIKWHIYCRLQ